MNDDPFPNVNYVVVEDKVFKHQVVALDNHSYDRCKFEDCKILWAGGPFQFLLCKITHCFFGYTGQVASVLNNLEDFSAASGEIIIQAMGDDVM